MMWMQTYTGKKFNYRSPAPEMVDIYDIARALSMQCRFNGHVAEFFSVAQHSVFVELHLTHLSANLRLQGLLHDAVEAYLGDIVSPLKWFLPVLAEAESRIWCTICEKFNLEVRLHPDVRKADKLMLMREVMELLPINMVHEWNEKGPPSNLIKKIIPLDPMHAEKLFLDTFEKLKGLVDAG